MKTLPPLNTLRCLLFRSFLCLVSVVAPNTLNAADDMLVPTQDAHIRSGSAAGDNFNTHQLELAGRTASVDRKIYLQFELSQKSAQITKARLQMTLKGIIANPDDPVDGKFQFKVFASISDNPNLWDETSITWKNAPANSGDVTKVDAPWVEVGSAEVEFPLKTQNQTIEVNLAGLPDLLKKEAGRNLTLILVPAVRDAKAPGVYFYSRQSSRSELWPNLILVH